VELANPDLDVTPDISLEKEDTVPYPTQQIICLLILALAEPIQVSQKSPNIPQVSYLHVLYYLMFDIEPP